METVEKLEKMQAQIENEQRYGGRSGLGSVLLTIVDTQIKQQVRINRLERLLHPEFLEPPPS